ncbi:MAG: hypothetical protein ACE5NM_11240 [Sedimentisphaerales bacterium]
MLDAGYWYCVNDDLTAVIPHLMRDPELPVEWDCCLRRKDNTIL